MLPGIAIYYLKQHKMMTSGMGAQCTFHLRDLFATVQLKPVHLITEGK